MRPFQFSLRTLMLVATFATLIVGSITEFVRWENALSEVRQREAKCTESALAMQAASQGLHEYSYGEQSHAAGELEHIMIPFRCGQGAHVHRFEVDSSWPHNVVGMVLDASSIKDKDMTLLAKLIYLQKLTVRGPNVTDAGLINLAGLKELQELNLCGITLSDRTFFIINALPSLKKLTLYDCRWQDADGQEIQKAKANPSLEIVELKPGQPIPQ